MLPLAAYLYKTGRLQDIYSRLDDQGVCFSYQPDIVVKDHGRCVNYAYRPGICRLFGFSVKQDGQGKKQMITCRIIKEELIDDYNEAIQHMDDGKPVVLTNDYAMKVFAIDPIDGRELMPINLALKKALQKMETHLCP